MGRVTKRRFCKFAKKRSGMRKKMLRTFRKKSAAARRTRRSHLNAYCKHATKGDTKFCRKAKSMSEKRFRYDKKVVRGLLKRATKRRRALYSHCK